MPKSDTVLGQILKNKTHIPVRTLYLNFNVVNLMGPTGTHSEMLCNPGGYKTLRSGQVVACHWLNILDSL